MKTETLFQIFNNNFITSTIQYYLPNYVKYPELILKNCYVKGGIVKYLPHNDFVIYCGLKLGFNQILNSRQLHLKVSPKLIDAIAEENELGMLKTLFNNHISILINSIYSTNNITFGTYRSLLSAIKNQNLDMLIFLHQKLGIEIDNTNTINTTNTNTTNTINTINTINTTNFVVRTNRYSLSHELNYSLNNKYQTFLNLVTIIGNLSIMKYVYQNLLNKYQFTPYDLNKQITLGIEYCNIDCCLYLLDKYPHFVSKITRNKFIGIQRNIITQSTQLVKDSFLKIQDINWWFLTELDHFMKSNIINTTNTDNSADSYINFLIKQIRIYKNSIMSNELKFISIRDTLFTLSKYIDWNKYSYSNLLIIGSHFKKYTQGDILIKIVNKMSLEYYKNNIRPDIKETYDSFKNIYNILDNIRHPVIENRPRITSV